MVMVQIKAKAAVCRKLMICMINIKVFVPSNSPCRLGTKLIAVMQKYVDAVKICKIVNGKDFCFAK